MSESRYLIDNVFYVLCYVHWTLWRCLLKSSPIEFFELFPNTSVLNVNVCCIDLDASAEEDCRCQPPVIVIFLVYIFFFFCLCKFEKRQLDEGCIAKLMFIQSFLGEDLILIDSLNTYLFLSLKKKKKDVIFEMTKQHLDGQDRQQDIVKEKLKRDLS